VAQNTAAVPEWLAALGDDDFPFIGRFVLASGSLKALATEYGVSYPTVRARLDRLIAKIQAAQDATVADPFERRLCILMADGKVTAAIARDLLEAHRDAQKGEKDR